MAMPACVSTCAAMATATGSWRTSTSAEQDDALELIAWIRRQPWCTGRVGMFGISWGGFNGLQVAYRQPDGLDAMISLCSTDDRFADDIHYKGGCLLCEQLGWSSTMLAYSSRPADPAMSGAAWGAMAGTAGKGAAPGGGLDGAPDPRRVLEARLDLRGLRADPCAAVMLVGAAGPTATMTRCRGCSGT